MEHAIFTIILFIFAAFILLAIFTRKGRDFSIKMMYGGKVIEDLGEVGQTKVLLGTQKVTLLKCSSKGTVYFILETQTVAGLGVRYAFTKIDDEMLIKLNTLTNSKAHSVN